MNAEERLFTARQPGQDPVRIQVSICGSSLPGRDIGPGGNFPGARNIHVGVQEVYRKDRPVELLGLTPGDAPSARWDFEATATSAGAGFDIKGTYIQGRPGARFIYLAWGAIDDGAFNMFRRAKLQLDAIDPATLDAARRHGSLIAHLELTDAKGHLEVHDLRRECRAHHCIVKVQALPATDDRVPVDPRIRGVGANHAPNALAHRHEQPAHIRIGAGHHRFHER